MKNNALVLKNNIEIKPKFEFLKFGKGNISNMNKIFKYFLPENEIPDEK